MGKQKFYSGIRVGKAGFSIADLNSSIKADPAAYCARFAQMVEKGDINLGQVNIRALYQATAGVQVPVHFEDVGMQRAVMASAFPVLAGNLMVAEINAAYDRYPTIGESLVTDIDDAKKVTTIAAVFDEDKDADTVPENQDFPEIGVSEESVQIRSNRNGRMLTVTAEMIEENDIANIVEKINGIARISSNRIEKQTLRRITDHDGSKASAAEPYVYRPNGTGTALFSATANTPGPRAPSGNRINSNALADETDLDAARTRLRSMKDNSGDRINIPWSEVYLLVPDALLGTALKALNSEYVPGVENELSNWGPRGMFWINPERVKSSPLLDDLSSAAWYLGAFKRQYRRKWKLRMEYVTLGMDTESYLRRRVAFQARMAWDCEIGAVDYVNVVQCLSATTAPADE